MNTSKTNFSIRIIIQMKGSYELYDPSLMSTPATPFEALSTGIITLYMIEVPSKYQGKEILSQY